MRECDWAATPVGPPESRPQPLRTTLSLMLDNGHGMFVANSPASATCRPLPQRPLYVSK